MLRQTISFLLFVFLASATLSYAQGDDEEVEVVKKICLQKRFYLHQYYLGCEAEYEEADVKKVCPYRFYCPKLEAPGNENQCHVDGKAYNAGERVPNDNKCRECFCAEADKKSGEPARVECSAIECKNVEPLIQSREEECFFTFPKADSCCPTRKCIKRNSTDPICEHDGLKFHSGQKIFPSENPCKVCLCNRNWAGINGQTCTNVQCDMKVERERLLEGCTPVYFQKSCCPVDWVCPKQLSSIPDNADPDKCYFGGKAYGYNENLLNAHPSPCVQCKCVAPNSFTCIQESCPAPPVPRRGYECIPLDNKGKCCPQFDCSRRIKDPCASKRCGREQKCMRFLEKCQKPPCKDVADCVPKDFHPCNDYTCKKSEICVPHQFPCAARHCPVTAACLPKDPCKDEQLQCEKDKICRNVINPCLIPPCPKVARCVNKDPCVGHRCRPNHVCRGVNIPECREEPCPKDPVCYSPNCPEARCDRNSVYRPFGKGKDNCSFCEPIPRQKAPPRQAPPRQAPPRRRQ